MLMKNAKMSAFYQRILWMCLAVLLLLTFFQAILYFGFSSLQFQGYVSDLSSKVISDISLNIDSYFNLLDGHLNGIYQYPEFLEKLNTDSLERFELPTRNLLSQTSFFRALQGVYVYNNAHVLKSSYRRAKDSTDLDIFSSGDEASNDVLDFLATSGRRMAVLCSLSGSKMEYVRVVKRIYQNMGHTQVGYIVCDLSTIDLMQLVADSACASDQYVWILSINGRGCFLSPAQENAQAYMRAHLDAAPLGSCEKLDRGNHYYQTAVSTYGIVSCVFTDETQMRNNYWAILAVLLQGLLGAVALFIGAGIMLSRRVNRRINGVTHTLSLIASGDTHQRLPGSGNDEIAVICRNFNDMMDQLEVRTTAEEQARRALDDARYQALQAQVNPHFLYNTMENIGAIASSQNCHVVDEMCVALSKMLRYSIQADDAEKCMTIREEMAYVEDYMFIIGVRMGHDIHMRVEIEDALWEATLPRLSIQPLIENSIRHGLRTKRGEKHIFVRARGVQGDVVITVEDNGACVDAQMLNQIIRGELIKAESHTSIGMQNIQRRVQILFGEAYGLTASVEDGMTRVTLRLPFRERAKDQ